MPVRRPRHKLARRVGIDIWGTAKPSLLRRLKQPPGARPGERPRRLSEYARQLLEKQKVKWMYGLREQQFARTFARAARLPGDPGANLLSLLERRLDNVVYRAGFARTRLTARQLVSHGHVLVNGRRVDIPSYEVQPGDVVVLSPRAAGIPGVQELLANPPAKVPDWLAREDTAARVLRLPGREDVEAHIDTSRIVAFYSRRM